MSLDDDAKRELSRCLIQLQENAYKMQECIDKLNDVLIKLLDEDEENDAQQDSLPEPELVCSK